MAIRISQAGKMRERKSGGGVRIRSWSLPAIDSCPGSRIMEGPMKGELVDACAGCYATEGNYHWPNTKKARSENMADWRRDSWVDDMVKELDNDRYFRWMDSGDIYTKELAEKILAVMQRTP